MRQCICACSCWKASTKTQVVLNLGIWSSSCPIQEWRECSIFFCNIWHIVHDQIELPDIGVHSKRVPAFVLPDRCLQARGLDPTVERGAADTRSKMRPDMMLLEMTTAEQQQYLRHDDNSGSRLTPLTPLMPNGNPRSIKIVEGGYCSDTRYEEKLQEKGAQHKALEEALKDYGYNVTTLHIIIGQSGSQYHTTLPICLNA